jgi:hypothetical protein
VLRTPRNDGNCSSEIKIMDARDVIKIGMSAERRLVVPPEQTVGHLLERDGSSLNRLGIPKSGLF